MRRAQKSNSRQGGAHLCSQAARYFHEVLVRPQPNPTTQRTTREYAMTKMARRKFLKGVGLAGVGAASTAVAAPALAQALPEVKWRMPTSWPKSLDTLYGGAEHIAQRVALLTDNKFQIQV